MSRWAFAVGVAALILSAVWGVQVGVRELTTPPLKRVAKTCKVKASLDGGSITLRIRGEKKAGFNDGHELSCVLAKTKAPDHLLDLLSRTRAIDGMQTESWGDYEARWNYHPDDGLFLLVAHKP